jgi:hypothetical protein
LGDNIRVRLRRRSRRDSSTPVTVKLDDRSPLDTPTLTFLRFTSCTEA